MWDPKQYLGDRHPDVQVIAWDLPSPVQACCDHDRRIIWIARHLTEVEYRCALAFEVGQLELGPTPANPALAAMHQRAAAGWAAHMLIDSEAYVDCWRHSSRLVEIAAHLGVDLATMRARMRSATDEEYDRVLALAATSA